MSQAETTNAEQQEMTIAEMEQFPEPFRRVLYRTYPHCQREVLEGIKEIVAWAIEDYERERLKEHGESSVEQRERVQRPLGERDDKRGHENRARGGRSDAVAGGGGGGPEVCIPPGGATKCEYLGATASQHGHERLEATDQACGGYADSGGSEQREGENAGGRSETTPGDPVNRERSSAEGQRGTEQSSDACDVRRDEAVEGNDLEDRSPN
jgi:hypothetical protein